MLYLVYGPPSAGNHLVCRVLEEMGLLWAKQMIRDMMIENKEVDFADKKYVFFTHPYHPARITPDKIVKKINSEIKVIVPIRDMYCHMQSALNRHRAYYEQINNNKKIDNIYRLIGNAYRKIFDDIYLFNCDYLTISSSALMKLPLKILPSLEEYTKENFPVEKIAVIKNEDQKYYDCKSPQ
jgi:hypothetical protein